MFTKLMTQKKSKRILIISVLTFLVLSLTILALTPLAVSANNAEASQTTQKTDNSKTTSPGALAFIAAALAVGFSSIAAGIAVAQVGSAAIAAITEKPELMGRTLLIVGLAEGIAIYGLIIAIIILGKV